jgi:hypothetical protein
MPDITFTTRMNDAGQVVDKLESIEQKLDGLGRTGSESAKKVEDAFKSTGAGLQDTFKKTEDGLKKTEEGFKKTGFGFEDLGRKIQQFAENPLQSAKSGITSLLVELGPTAVGIAAVGSAAAIAGVALFKFAQGASENAKHLQNISYMTGLTVQDLQALNMITKEAGMEGMDLGRSISFMNQELARDPKQFREGMDKLGVSLIGANGKSKDALTLLNDLGVALQGMGNTSKAAELGIGAVGIRYREIIPLLMGLNGSLLENIQFMKDSGVVYDEVTQEHLMQYHEALEAIARVYESFKVGVTEIVAATIGPLVEGTQGLDAQIAKAQSLGIDARASLFESMDEYRGRLQMEIDAVGLVQKAHESGVDTYRRVGQGLDDYVAHLKAAITESQRQINVLTKAPSGSEFFEWTVDALNELSKMSQEDAKKAKEEWIRAAEAISASMVKEMFAAEAAINRVMNISIAPRNYPSGLPQFTAPGTNYRFPSVPKMSSSEIDKMTADITAAAVESTQIMDEAWASSWSDMNDLALQKLENIKEGAGEVFDAMLTRGKGAFQNLGDWIEATFMTRLRSIFQGFMGWLFGGMKGGFGGILEAVGAGRNGSLFSKGMGVLGLGSAFGGTAIAGTVGLGVGGSAALAAINPLNSVAAGVLGTSAGVGTAGVGAGAGSGGMMASIGALASNPITIAAAGAVAAYVLYKAFKAHDPVTAGAMEAVRDFKVKLSKDTVKSIYDSLGLSEGQAAGIRKDILSSPIALQKMGAAAQQQGVFDEFLTSLEKIETAWGTFDFRAAFELGNATGDWSELNKQFEDAFEHSQELQNILPNWREQLDALNNSTKMLAVSLTAFRDSIQGSITPVETMYDKFLKTGEITEEFAAQITKLGGDIEKFKNLANLTVELGGMQESLNFIQSLSSALENLAPGLDPINQILSGNIGSEAVDALKAAGLDPERFSSLSSLIGMEKQWDSVAKPFATMQSGGMLEKALLEFGGAAGKIAVDRYYQGQNTITQGLLDSTKAAMDKAYQDQIKSALAYIGTVEKETVDKMNDLISKINEAKIEVVDVLNQILNVLSVSGASGVTAGNQQLNPDYTQWQADYQYAQGNTEDIDKWVAEHPAPPLYMPGMKLGGWVEKTGLAVVHEGEQYSGVGKSLQGQTVIDIRIDMSGARVSNASEFVREVTDGLRQYFGGGGSLAMLKAR